MGKQRVYNIGVKAFEYTHGGRQYIIPPKNGQWEVVHEKKHREFPPESGKFISYMQPVLKDVAPEAKDQANWCDIPDDLAKRLESLDLRDTHVCMLPGGTEPVRCIVPQSQYRAAFISEDQALANQIEEKRRKLAELEAEEKKLQERLSLPPTTGVVMSDPEVPKATEKKGK